MSGLRAREIEARVNSYEGLRDSFRWQVPERFNIGFAACDRHAADPERAARVALVFEDHAGHVSEFTFAELKRQSDRLALVLAARGLRRGDRFAILLPQQLETGVAHLAAYKLGLIALPLTVLFRQDALRYRLENSGAQGIITSLEMLPLLETLLPDLPQLHTVILADAPSAPPDTLAGVTLLTYAWAREQSRGGFQSVDTHADDPAVLIYTSGTTGNPKGALHAHRVLIGHLPGFELSHDFLPQPGDRFWTPADWAWIGGLMDALLAAWYHAVPMVAYRGPGGFDPERAFWLMSRQGVRNAFIPPTALKMMAQVPEPLTRNPCALRSIMSGGEALGAETLAWAENTLGVRINEIYGQTEINYIVGNCAPLWPVRPGSMGRPYPGHTVAVVDASGTPVPPGVVGEIAVRRDNDPVFFLEYWNQPRATREKFIGPWGLTGDLAECDPEGYLWFKGRKDDVIISAGYRIGPAEVEAALQRHPAVGLAAVVASPDPVRGHIVKAFVRPRPGFSPTTELAVEIKNFVKERLARHEYPREIEFLQEFPLTTTGKIRRKDLRTLEEARKGEKGAFPE